MPELPQKLFFRIGEVAGLVGVEPHVLRYWEREFRSIRPTKSAKGQRVYSRKDVENLLRVRDLLYRDGFTIAGAKKKLHQVAQPGAPRASVQGPVASNARTAASIPDAPTAPEHDEHDEEEEEEVRSPAPPGPTVAAEERAAAAPTPGVRAKLLALRGEVEALLAELSDG